MIRPITLITLLVAAGAGLNLYSVKREAQIEEQTTVKITRDAKEVHAHAALLHAEYDLLSDPDRLQELARQVLNLQPTDPKQYVSLADLTKRLPAVAPLPAPPEAPKVEAPKIEAPKPELVAEKPAEKVVAEKTEPKPIADKPAADKPVQVATISKPTAATSTVLASVPQPTPQPAPRPIPRPQPPTAIAEARPTPVVQAPVQPQYHPPVAPRPMPAVAEAPAPAPYSGSALGMARSRSQSATPARYISSDSGADR